MSKNFRYRKIRAPQFRKYYTMRNNSNDFKYNFEISQKDKKHKKLRCFSVHQHTDQNENVGTTAKNEKNRTVPAKTGRVITSSIESNCIFMSEEKN